MPGIAEVLDGFGEVLGAVEAVTYKGLAGENAEPALDLIEL